MGISSEVLGVGSHPEPALMLAHECGHLLLACLHDEYVPCDRTYETSQSHADNDYPLHAISAVEGFWWREHMQ